MGIGNEHHHSPPFSVRPAVGLPVRSADEMQDLPVNVLLSRIFEFFPDMSSDRFDIGLEHVHILEYVVVDPLEDVVRAAVFPCTNLVCVVDQSGTERSYSGNGPCNVEMGDDIFQICHIELQFYVLYYVWIYHTKITKTFVKNQRGNRINLKIINLCKIILNVQRSGTSCPYICIEKNKCMTPFLKQVAQGYFGDGKLDGSCFVFPNRRSMVFFRKYVAETVAASGSAVPVIMPAMITENDLFYSLCRLPVTDRVTQLLLLYDCYRALNPKAEPLDEFIFWGDIILADFNDADKYLADPHQLFTNVSDYKAIQDNYSYLTEKQRSAIERFVSHFGERNSRLTVDIGSGKPDVKSRFLQIWNILEPLYFSYNKVLQEKGLAYEGMVYRNAVKVLDGKPVPDVLNDAFPGVKRFVFVGLNALNECEKTVMRRIRDVSMAEFCWDYSGKLIRDRRNRSSFFMEDNVREFPQAYVWDKEGLDIPSVNVISVPSSVGQTKLVPDLVRDREDCAIVLPDEHLLMPLLDSIPPEVKDINVTMGYSISSSTFYSLMSDISAMQLHLRQKNDGWSFYYRQVWSIFSNGVFKRLASSDADCIKIVEKIKEGKKIYIPWNDFKGSRLLELIFRPVITDQKATDPGQIRAYAEYQKEVIAGLASRFCSSDNMLIETEFAKAYYCDVTRLSSYDLAVMPVTYVRLLEQIVGAETIPFKGEPLKGMQIMGPLETRALDFRNLVILSANEGTFPRRNVSSSFIPPELRRGFGLPTYEYQDAVWAYYFYRMIQRAENVWMIYDSRTEGLHVGEESRFIKQLVYHFRIRINRFIAGAGPGSSESAAEIPKTEEDIIAIRSKCLSATSLQNYLACPARFCYGTVKGLRAEDEVSETLDSGMFGTIYHDVMWALFAGEEAMADDADMDRLKQGDRNLAPDSMKRVSREYLVSWTGREDRIRRKVRSLICSQLKTDEISGRNLVILDVIVRYVLKTLERDIELLDRNQASAFEMVGTEKEFRADFHGFHFRGFVDRIDRLSSGKTRVSDYKTGKVDDADILIDDGNADAVAEAVFGKDDAKRPKIALQFFIYDLLLKENGFEGEIFNSVYQTGRIFKEEVPVIPVSGRFYAEMQDRLKGLLDEMADISIPFRRTENTEVCSYCDFRKICGR